MADAMIVVLLVLIVIVAVKSSLKHFQGRGGCCGGGGSTSVKIPEKKLAGPTLGEMKVTISGIHCDHCALSVTKAINRIDGASAKVSLKKNQAVVSYDRPVSKEAIIKAIEAEGFHVTGIRK